MNFLTSAANVSLIDEDYDMPAAPSTDDIKSRLKEYDDESDGDDFDVESVFSDEIDTLYEDVSRIMRSAFLQIAYGKGRERHADKKPFSEQISCWIERRCRGYACGQALKKIDESLRMEPERAIPELMGAINYLVVAIKVLEENA